MNIIFSGREAVSNYVDGYQNHQFKDLVGDLNKLLTNQNLPLEKRQEIAERIAAIDSHSKSARAKADLVNLCLDIADFTGSLFGPAGSGLTALATSKPHRTNELQRKAKVCKARKAGGRRHWKRGGDKCCIPTDQRALQPDANSVKDSLITGVMDAAINLLTSPLPSPTSILSGCWSVISSYFSV